MSEYMLLHALKDELALATDIYNAHVAEYGTELAGSTYRIAYEVQMESLKRIIKRYEDGIEYTLDGLNIRTKQTTKHLEREFPEVAEAVENLNRVVDQARIMQKIKE